MGSEQFSSDKGDDLFKNEDYFSGIKIIFSPTKISFSPTKVTEQL